MQPFLTWKPCNPMRRVPSDKETKMVRSGKLQCNAGKFPLRQSIVVSLTSTALLERVGWEAEGNGKYLKWDGHYSLVCPTTVIWKMETWTVVSPVISKQVNPSKCLWLIKQRIWAVVSFLLQLIDHTDVGVKTEPKSSVMCIVIQSEITLNQTTFVEWHGLRDLVPIIIGRKLSSQRTQVR